MQKLDELITQLGNRYASDTLLSHVYVTQMTVNGVEGHLNGIDMTSFKTEGYTDQKWISSAKSTAIAFADAFPEKPIVFEIHEIDRDTIVPATIINDLTNDPNLCNRVGLGMWWLSGKTSYQTSLIEFISHYKGDKYAQVIGRSDQLNRFEDSLYSNVFTQAKQLGIRYIEPWPYEFQYRTHDDLIKDFNEWADANFSTLDTCPLSTSNNEIKIDDEPIILYPNPIQDQLNIQIDFDYQKMNVSIFNMEGKLLLHTENQTSIHLNHIPKGVYIVQCIIDEMISTQKVIKLN